MADENLPDTKAGGDEEESSPWGTLFWGVVLLAAGIGLYFYFGKLESEGGSVRMNAIVLALYKVAGRTGVLVVLGGIGALMSVLGIKEIVGGSKK